MKTLEEYLTLTYPIELIPDTEQGGYFAQHPTLPGCMAQGETADEAVASLNEARTEWITARLKAHQPVPEPASTQPSGKFLLRMPSWLHADLTVLAEREGTSLNQLLVSVLASHLGMRTQSTQMTELLTEIKGLKEALRTPATAAVLGYMPKTIKYVSKGLGHSFYSGRTVELNAKTLQGTEAWSQGLSNAPTEVEPDTRMDLTDLLIYDQQSRR